MESMLWRVSVNCSLYIIIAFFFFFGIDSIVKLYLLTEGADMLKEFIASKNVKCLQEVSRN